MNIVLSHISALKFWLSRPDCAPKLRHGTASLPANSVPKDTAASLRRSFPSPVHVLCSVPIKGGGLHGVVHHAWRSPLPEGALYCIGPGVSVCSPEFAFAQVAQSLGEIDLIRLGYELCGCYALSRQSDGGFFKRQPVTSPVKLREFCASMPGARGSRKGYLAASHVLSGSASPAETRLAMTLMLPYVRGGADLPAARLNYQIKLSPSEQKLLRRSYFQCDLFWSDQRLAVEYDSDAFHAGTDKLARDAERRNALEHIDITVITVTADAFREVRKFDEVATMIAVRLGRRYRPRCKDFHVRQRELRDILRHEPIWL